VLNTAAGAGSFVGGGGFDGTDNSGNQARGAASTVAGGWGNVITTTGAFATIGGGMSNTASGSRATVPGGEDAQASHYGEFAFASGAFSVGGDAQTSLYVLRRQTTNANTTELMLDNSSSRITIASGRTVSFDVLVVARSTTGLSAGYHMYGVIENVSGTTALVGTLTKITLGEDAPAWDANAEADNTNDALVIKVSGAASTTIRWVATVRTAEVAN
jgi:hypothetical protein